MKDGDTALRRKNNGNTFSDNAGIRRWFKYRDDPTFGLPQRIITKCHNGDIANRDVINYRM